LSADAFLEASLRVDTVATVVDAVAGLSTLNRFPEAAAQIAAADRLLLSKTDIAVPPPDLLDELASLNPMAKITDASDAEPLATLFGNMAVAVPRRSRFVASAVHAHGIVAHIVILRRPMSRFEFAVALGGLARDHGEDLLRVKGLVAFADRDGGPAAVHAVQHTMYPPRWLDAWPDADQSSRLVFIVRGLEETTILRHFTAGDPIITNGPKGEI
jgi:G3E family GTPase